MSQSQCWETDTHDIEVFGSGTVPSFPENDCMGFHHSGVGSDGLSLAHCWWPEGPGAANSATWYSLPTPVCLHAFLGLM